MNTRSRLFVATLLAPLASVAQDTPPATETALEEVLVTATKQAEAVAAQDVALAITAFSGEQLEKNFTKDLSSLTVSMPNVQLDSIGTQKATANFTIRGLGTNSSIPSIEPTVGIFYDGVYMGINAGIIYDFFDVASIEVLRGPQGLLFGRNVTGGAIVINTRKPSLTQFDGKVKMSVTDDLDKTVAASFSTPLIDGVLAARITGMYNDDDGWFTNKFDGEDFGISETWLVRPSLTWVPSDAVEVTLRLEHGEFEGQGSAGQNDGAGVTPALGGPHNRHTHSFSINEEGYSNDEWDFIALETNIDIGPGTLTNIFGWREFSNDGVADIDSLPITGFHARFVTDQEQVSDELRYAVNFESWKLTTGLYWFTQDLDYFEERQLGANLGHLGGVQESTTQGVFASADINLTDSLILNVGARYTKEEKDVRIATFAVGAATPCPLAIDGGIRGREPRASECTLPFVDSEEWTDTTPKVGLQYFASDDVQVYGFATKGFRSGGYNMRSSVPTIPPGPFDPEEQISYELGTKADWLDGTLRTNLAFFYNQIEDMQREINLPNPSGGVAQFIRNTADATIQGAELEVISSLTPYFLVTGNIGYTDGEYDKGSIKFDISGDGVINSVDEGLDIPRLAKLTWGIGFNLDLPIGQVGSLISKVDFNHRDRAAYTDNNRGTLNTVDMLNASFTLLLMDDQLSIGLFGKNLTDRVIEGNDTQLPTTLGGTGAAYRPLTKGRVYGLELSYKL